MSAMPIVYKNQTNVWMDSKIFSEWFENIFILGIKKHQLKIGRREKAALLVDNTRSHSTREFLNGKDKVARYKNNVTLHSYLC